MTEPKDLTTNEAFKGFTNEKCPFLPCHEGVKREFNCLFCYCPLAWLECPGPYVQFTSANGVVRKDCSACTLPHDGFNASWNFIQKWMADPKPWRPENDRLNDGGPLAVPQPEPAGDRGSAEE